MHILRLLHTLSFWLALFATEACIKDGDYREREVYDFEICDTTSAYPVDEEGLCELDHLQRDQQADGDQVVVQDDEGQQVVCKVCGDVTYNPPPKKQNKNIKKLSMD